MTGDRFLVIHRLHEIHGPVVRIGPQQLSIASPKTFHHVFVKNCGSFLKSEFYASIQPGVGDKYSGLFNYTDHQRALAERRDLQVQLSPTALRNFEKRFDPLLDTLIFKMKSRGESDLFTSLKHLLLDAIGDIAFNQSFGQLESGEDHQYVTDFNNAFMLIGLQVTFSWLIPFIPYLPVKAIQDAYFGLQRIFAYSQQRVDEYLASEGPKQGTLMCAFLDSETGKPKPPYDSFKIALAGHGFIVAGSEATSITLSYALWLLIKHPDVLLRLRNELETLRSGYTATDLAALPYLESVLRETLRVYPPAPSPMPRVVPVEGLKIENVEYPPGTIISAQPYSLHRDQELFEDPEVFRPQRWMEATEDQKVRMLKAFIPFSAGQRGCIGRGVAWMHMEKTLARILLEFTDLTLCRDMTERDMDLVERGALAKPRSTKLWVTYKNR